MNRDHLLASDAGTGSCRAALFDHLGRQVAVAQREWHHPSQRDVPGSQVFETGPNWRLICLCVREAIAKAGIRQSIE